MVCEVKVITYSVIEEGVNGFSILAKASGWPIGMNENYRVRSSLFYIHCSKKEERGGKKEGGREKGHGILIILMIGTIS